MEESTTFSLPRLAFGYGDSKPYMSEEQLRVSHQKHCNVCVTGAKNMLAKIHKARADNVDFDEKATLKELSWNIGGWWHMLRGRTE